MLYNFNCLRYLLTLIFWLFNHKLSLSACYFSPKLYFNFTILFFCFRHLFYNCIIISLSCLFKTGNLVTYKHFINDFTYFLSISKLLFCLEKLNLILLKLLFFTCILYFIKQTLFTWFYFRLLNLKIFCFWHCSQFTWLKLLFVF
jgi:hypothetical protein